MTLRNHRSLAPCFATGLALCFTAGLALCPVTVLHVVKPASAEEKLSRDQAQDQLKKRKRELEKVRGRETGLSTSAKDLDREWAKINTQLIDVAKRVQESEVKLGEIEARLGELDAQRALLMGSLQRQHATLGKLLAALQRMGRNPPPVVTTPRRDALGMVRSAMLLASIFPELRDKAQALASRLAELDRVMNEINTQGEQLRAENRQLVDARERLSALVTAKKSRLMQTQTELAEVRRIADQHKKRVANLNELISKLDRTVSEKAGLGSYEEELKAGTAPGQAPEPVRETQGGTQLETQVAMASPARIKPAIPFAKAKRRLAFPAKGQRLMGFGDKAKFGKKSKGIAVETRPGAQITSPNDGWVVYAGPFLSYGQLLIINAGGGYHVLLAGMAEIDVVVGQFVLSGEPVGKMSAKKRSSASRKEGVAPVLYIEFRKDGRPIDPDPWWSNGAKKVQG